MTIAFLTFIIVVLVYWFIVRPILKQSPTFSAAFAKEASAVDKVRAKVTGWRTKIIARLLAIAAFVVGLYDQLLPLAVGQDWTPITARLPGWTLPLGMVAVSYLILKLKDMTKRAPQVIVQKDETGTPLVVDVQPQAKA